MTKTHDKDYFYKYVTYARALDILTKLETWWCSPLQFNDPFDTHFGWHFGFPVDDLPAFVARRIERLMRCDDELSPDVAALFRWMVVGGRLLRTLGRLDELIPLLGACLREVSLVKQDQEALDMMWQVWLRSMRVFCVSEVHDDLLMWAHYADCHRGAVIQLRCIPEKDTALCAARRIDYRATIPAIANTAEEWAAHITGESRIDLKGRFFDVVFTKSDHWSYEKEWRCYSSARIGDNRPGEAMTLDPEVIMAVYLGCRMPPKDRDGVVRLVRERLMHVRVFQARQSASTFSLEFEPIT